MATYCPTDSVGPGTTRPSWARLDPWCYIAACNWLTTAPPQHSCHTPQQQPAAAAAAAATATAKDQPVKLWFPGLPRTPLPRSRPFQAPGANAPQLGPAPSVPLTLGPNIQQLPGPSLIPRIPSASWTGNNSLWRTPPKPVCTSRRTCSQTLPRILATALPTLTQTLAGSQLLMP